MNPKNRKFHRTHARIVIMDSDKEAVKLLMRSLSKEVYKVESVEHPSKMLEKIRNEQIDVLILAVESCGVKGNELIPKIKKISSFLPIIVTSADDSIEVAARVREHGIFFYALKPLDMKEIKLALRNALSRRLVSRYKLAVSQKEKVTHRDFEDEILDLAAASRILKLSKRTINKLAKKGEIPASRAGKKWYFIRNQLLEWLRITAAGNQKNYGTLILETMDEGVAVVDKRLKIVSCNSAYLQALDVPRDRIIGEYCYRVSHRSIVPCDESTCPVRQAFKTKRSVKFMHINYDNEGNEHYCDVIALPIKDKKNEVSRVVEVIRDNTEIYNLNKHLNWIMSFFAHASKKTLGSVVMNISALIDENLSKTLTIDKRNKMLLSSLCNLKLMHDMIRNYIISCKDENRQLQCSKELVDLKKDVLELIISELKPVLDNKEITINIEVKGEPLVYCDPSLMKVAFSNLINNATKYGTARTKIQCVLTKTGKEFEFNILNEGFGIPRDKLHDVFDRFSRFDKVGISGIGLGLHVVRIIAEMHSGTVTVESGYLIDDRPITYDEFDANANIYNMKEEDLKKFARFILKIPVGKEGHTMEV